MVPPTRRRVLHSSAGLLAILAGCGGSTSTSSTATESSRRHDFDPNSIPPHYRLRSPQDDPLLWLPSVESDGQAAQRRQPEFIASRLDADRVRFADISGTDEARRFLAETDFGSETIYLQRYPVPSCYELQLCHVSWTERSIDTQFGRILRDVDVKCDAQTREATTWLIRLPTVLDPDAISRFGSGSGGGPCGDRGRPVDRSTPITAQSVPASNRTEGADDA